MTPGDGSERTTRDEREPPEGGLTVCLWVIAALAATLELVWWFADRLYSTA
jgi:hypothetical protein